MNSVQYRRLKADDLDSYREIRLECLQNNPAEFGTTYEEALRTSSPKMSHVLLQTDTGSFLAGAFQNHTLIGICGFLQEPRLKTRHRGSIVQMYVKPTHEGRGVGSNLLRFTLDTAFANDSTEQIELGVVDSNASALAVYRRVGFVEYGLLETCFKQNDDYRAMVLMVLTKHNYIRKNRSAP
ncbi:MAG: GNAT family N-acetyltransferase [Sphingobacteriaceae bacterium]|nr:GNAT family N-acetyltransferase [Cytophagaceae bacterium]